MDSYESLGVIAGVIVGMALVSAGVFKLRDGPAWPRQAADMGVGRSVSLTVPWVELILGAMTMAQILRPWPAVASGLLLLVFTALIVVRLLDGSRPPCACFGSRSTRPLGVSHIVRNFVLVALAALAVWAS